MPFNILSPEQIATRLTEYPDWTLADGGWLQSDFIFENFPQAMRFVNALAAIAEEIDHHPDILIHNYKHVRLSTTSHDVGGITKRDFRLLTRIASFNE